MRPSVRRPVFAFHMAVLRPRGLGGYGCIKSSLVQRAEVHHDEKRIVFVVQVEVGQSFAVLVHECDVGVGERQDALPLGDEPMRPLRQPWDGQDRANQKLGVVLHVRREASSKAAIHQRVYQVQTEPFHIGDERVELGRRGGGRRRVDDDVRQRGAARRARALRQSEVARGAEGVAASPVARRFVVAHRTLARKGVAAVRAEVVGLGVGDVAPTAPSHLSCSNRIGRCAMRIARLDFTFSRRFRLCTL